MHRRKYEVVVDTRREMAGAKLSHEDEMLISMLLGMAFDNSPFTGLLSSPIPPIC